MDDDAEEVAKQELTQFVEQLDELDRKRQLAWSKVEMSLKDLAKARGVSFLRLESFRDELRRQEKASG